MSLNFFRKQGFQFPPKETEEGLKAKDIINKMRSFQNRFEECDSEITEFAESEFLELLTDYPLSMCSRQITEILKQLITLYYLASKPNPETKEKDDWPGYSYDDLSLIFDRSKASIHDAIKEKEAEVKELVEAVKLKAKAKAIALKELVEEEKKKLREEKEREG